MVTIGPDIAQSHESYSSCLFGQRSMLVKINAIIHEDIDYKALSVRLQAQVDELGDQVRQYQLRDARASEEAVREYMAEADRRVQEAERVCPFYVHACACVFVCVCITCMCVYGRVCLWTYVCTCIKVTAYLDLCIGVYFRIFQTVHVCAHMCVFGCTGVVYVQVHECSWHSVCSCKGALIVRLLILLWCIFTPPVSFIVFPAKNPVCMCICMSAHDGIALVHIDCSFCTLWTGSCFFVIVLKVKFGEASLLSLGVLLCCSANGDHATKLRAATAERYAFSTGRYTSINDGGHAS